MHGDEPPDAFFISGAGPSGLAAALTIANAGGRAVVFERQADVGSRFHGDFQGLENWTTRQDALEELASAGIEPQFDAVPVRAGVVFDAAGNEYRCRSSTPLFYLVRRGQEPGMLDHSLKTQALAAGVEIRFGEAKHELPQGGIVAEGPRAADVIAAGFVFETGMADGCFVAFSDQLAPQGYSYLLVHHGVGTVAACLFRDFHNERNYVEHTVEFFRRHAGLKMQNERRFGGFGNFTYPATARNGRLLFAGESAGFQDALWGFGMRYGMLSGHLAACALMNHRAADYDALWRKRLGGYLRASYVNRYLFGKLGDARYTRLARRAGSANDARDWLRRYYATSWWKELLSPLARRALRTSSKAGVCVMEGCDCTWCRCHHSASGSV